MKKAFKILSVYIGTVIGAGFASGKEIFVFFNQPSNGNAHGIIISAFLFMYTAFIILEKSSREKITTFDGYIDSVSGKLSPVIKIFMPIFMYCTFSVMLSGAGSLLSFVSPCSSILGSILMALLSFLVICFDIKGLVTLNLFLVPIMIFGIIFVAFSTAIFETVPTFSGNSSTIKAIVISSVCYSSYNLISIGSVLVPLAENSSIKTIRRASALGGFIIGLLILIIFTAQNISYDKLLNSDLPMLTLASFCGKAQKSIYLFVLFSSIFTTAVSSAYGVLHRFGNKIKSFKDRVFISAVICLSALPFSIYGFSNLINLIYPLLGYIGMFWLIIIFVDRFR